MLKLQDVKLWSWHYGQVAHSLGPLPTMTRLGIVCPLKKMVPIESSSSSKLDYTISMGATSTQYKRMPFNEAQIDKATFARHVFSLL
jgi:hypothetical protein